MKKTLVILAASLLATIAPQQVLAQNTAQAQQFRHDMCSVVARRGANAWQFRMAGENYPIHKVPPSASTQMQMKAITFAMTEAGSQEEAFKYGYAMCLDNVDAVFRAERDGRVMTEAEMR